LNILRDGTQLVFKHYDSLESGEIGMSRIGRFYLVTILFTLLVGWRSETAQARNFRVSLIPNGSANNCSNCHFNPGGGGARNPFGEDVNPLVSRGGREEFWSPTLASEDSDEDGFTNGQELGDLDGDGIRERTVNISRPGDPNDVPEIAIGDCNVDFELNRTDLSCVSSIEARDAVLTSLNTLPGDLDGNGDVAFADFLVLSGNFGQDLPSYAAGNIDLTGPVDFADFLALSGNFGQTPAGATLSAVPEPHGILPMLLGLLTSLSLRRSRHDG
jgi:hypothetical protein